MNVNISCIFANKSDAEQAFEALREIGVSQKDISIIMKDEEEGRIKNNSGKTAVGATTGGIVGGLAGVLLGISAIIIPGIGAVVIGGPIVTALGLSGAAATAATAVSGGVAGALAGGLVGGLVGLGLSEEDAKLYESKIRKGAVLFYINSSQDDEHMIKRILENNNAMEIQTVMTQ